MVRELINKFIQLRTFCHRCVKSSINVRDRYITRVLKIIHKYPKLKILINHEYSKRYNESENLYLSRRKINISQSQITFVGLKI